MTALSQSNGLAQYEHFRELGERADNQDYAQLSSLSLASSFPGLSGPFQLASVITLPANTHRVTIGGEMQ
jgi:hypothetical protein